MALQADFLAMDPEDALGNTVEGPAPELPPGNRGQILDPFQHFAGGFIGKGEEENFVRLNAVVEEVGDPVGEGAGFARSRARQHEGGAGFRRDRRVLLRIQFALEINGRKAGHEVVNRLGHPPI